MNGSPWRLPKEALSACNPADLPGIASCTVFEAASCPSYDFYNQHKTNPCMFGVRLLGNDGRGVPFKVLDLAARSAWLEAYVENR